MTLHLVHSSLDPDDMLEELISLRGQLAAANRIIAAQSQAISTIHSAILSSRTTLGMAIAMAEAVEDCK